jgi:hypothetical protein
MDALGTAIIICKWFIELKEMNDEAKEGMREMRGTIVRMHPVLSSDAFSPAHLQNMCLLTSPASSTSSTPSFLFHHSAQFFVFFLLFHFFLF